MQDYDRNNYALIDGSLVSRLSFETFVSKRWGKDILNKVKTAGPDLGIEIRTLKLVVHRARIREIEDKMRNKE